MHTISNLSNSSFLMIIQRRSACKILCRLKVFCCSFPASLKPLNCFFPTSLLLWLLVVTSKATCIWAWSLTITKHQLLHTSSVYWQFVKSYYLCFPSKALILDWWHFVRYTELVHYLLSLNSLCMHGWYSDVDAKNVMTVEVNVGGWRSVFTFYAYEV